MRWTTGVLIFGILTISCKLEPKTTIVKPQKFDKKEYGVQLKKERDSLSHPKKINLKNTKTKTDSLKKSTSETIQFTEKTDTIRLKIVYGKAKIDTVKLPRQKLVFVVDSDTASKLKLKLTSQDSTSNVRISQIIDSKENSDGPFGREIDFPVKEKGIQKIIVSENQMQGNPWGGRFSLEVKLGW